MAARRTRWWTVLPTATLTVASFVCAAPSAQAFFPPVSGGNPSNPPPVIVVPPVSPPPFVRPPTVTPPVVVDPPTPQHPHCVPEPSTLVVGLIGLAAAGIARRRGKK